jgi:hypothetical protein
MKLIINHVGRDNWRLHAPCSIDAPVPIPKVLREARKDLSTDQLGELQRDLRSRFGEQAYSWGLPAGAKPLLNRMNPGDAAIFVSGISPSEGDGDVECVAWIEYVAGEPLHHVSRSIWGSSHFHWLFFFSDRMLLRMPWRRLLEDLGYQSDFNPRGLAWSVADWRVTRVGGVKAYVSGIERTYSI